VLRTNRVTTVGCTTPLCMYTCTCSTCGSIGWDLFDVRQVHVVAQTSVTSRGWSDVWCVTCCGVAESIVDLMSRRALVGRSLSPRWDRGRFCNIPRAIHLPERTKGIFIGYESCRFLIQVQWYGSGSAPAAAPRTVGRASPRPVVWSVLLLPA
jgi:hypothetical protein